MRRQSLDFQQGPNFDCADLRHRNSLGDAHGLVEISRLDQVVTTELFPSFREWTIGYQSPAVSYPNTSSSRSRVQRPRRQVFTTGAEILGELCRLEVPMLAFSFTQTVFIQVKQQHVFHDL